MSPGGGDMVPWEIKNGVPGHIQDSVNKCGLFLFLKFGLNQFKYFLPLKDRQLICFPVLHGNLDSGGKELKKRSDLAKACGFHL